MATLVETQPRQSWADLVKKEENRAKNPDTRGGSDNVENSKTKETVAWILPEAPPTMVVKPLKAIMAEQVAEYERLEAEKLADEIAANKAAEAINNYCKEQGITYEMFIAYETIIAYEMFYYSSEVSPAALEIPLDVAWFDECPWSAEGPSVGEEPSQVARDSPTQKLPKSVSYVLKTQQLSDLLCPFCVACRNFEYGGNTGEKLVSAFCGSCLVKLSRAPEFACSCGGPRHLDSLGKLSGKLCSKCHQAKHAPPAAPIKKKRGSRRRATGRHD